MGPYRSDSLATTMTKEAELRKRAAQLNYHLGIMKSPSDLTSWAEKINSSKVHADGKEFSCSLLVGLTVTNPMINDSETRTVFDLDFGNTVHLGDGRSGNFVGTINNNFRSLCVVFHSGSGDLELYSPAAIKSVDKTAEELDPAALVRAWGLCFGDGTDVQGKERYPGLRPRHKTDSPGDVEDESPKPSSRSSSKRQRKTKKTKKTRTKGKAPEEDVISKPRLQKKTSPLVLHKCYCKECRGNKSYVSEKTIDRHMANNGHMNALCSPEVCDL